MTKLIVLLFLAGSLAGCAGATATVAPDAAPPPAAQAATASSSEASDAQPDDDAAMTADGVRVRGIDPAAQKALVDRMKACCGPAK